MHHMQDIIDKRARADGFRARLAQAMGDSGLSQSALARRIGVDRSTISQLLTGDGPRLHVHPYDETFVVLTGAARFFVGDAVIDASAGEVVFGPAGLPHRFENLGPGRLQTLDIHHSPRWIQTDLE